LIKYKKEEAMLASVRALLTGIIDHAGMFPPAKLPLGEAIRNYARYRAEPESWMLGRFICPAARLAELAPFLKELKTGQLPIRISALGRGGKDFSELKRAVQEDFQSIISFNRIHHQLARVDSVEMKVDDDLDYHELLGAMEEHRQEMFADGEDLAIYYEYVPSKDLSEQDSREKTAEFISFLNQSGSGFFKLRCGGPGPVDVPTCAQVAHILTRCRREEIPLKLTAGLHHPIRHFDAELQVPMHGFLNIFTAAVLTYSRGMEEKHIQAIVEDEDAGYFSFSEEGLSWKDSHASTEQIGIARRAFILSFGSCSFDEPREDLRALGLVP
jgi:hypothetical protein